MSHISVMTNQMVKALAPHRDGLYLDCSFGGGGHSRAILAHCPCRILAIDKDPKAVLKARAMKASFGARFDIVYGYFSQIGEILKNRNIHHIDGLIFDAGLSSLQLDDGERGFSFSHDGPLDMRMDQSQSPSAFDIIHRLSEKELSDILYLYGEERWAKKIARAIVKERHRAPIETTKRLADMIMKAKPFQRFSKIHPATRSFQALRIFVNNELQELYDGLCQAECFLKAGGNLVVISFHSLEDRIVKNFFKTRSGRDFNENRYEPLAERLEPSFTITKPFLYRPDDDEIKANPRARSARLRWGQRTTAPAQHAQNLSLPSAR